jgi:hypothetical protein
MPVDRIVKRDVAACILRIEKNRGARTASVARTALSTMFTWGMQTGLCEVSPVIGTVNPENAKPRERVLDDVEIEAIWRAAGDDDFGKMPEAQRAMWALFWNFRGGVDGHSFSQLEIGVLISGGPALVREIGLALQPPQDIPIVLTEDPGAMPNWVAAAAIMQAARTGKFFRESRRT